MDTRAACRIFRVLARVYPEAVGDDPACEDPFRVLVATILSAQTTDRQVESIMSELFSRYPDPASLAAADTEDLERTVRPTGYYHAKARHLVAASRALVDRFGGNVPLTMGALLSLPGVGRKTANIVLSACGRDEGIAVDTHVFRIARRIGLSGGKSPDRVEQDLLALFPRHVWGKVNGLFITHGRILCTARKPKCGECPVRRSCRYYRSL
ncbi:MAG: endonuclease III [Methanomicrobiales archaeon]|nr:endonuclease III [Methanomicrobiales archaeon]